MMLGPGDCARYVIDTAYYWADCMGLSEKFSEDKGLYWVIHEIEIQFLEPMNFMDEFELTIWMPEWR
jgi:acyl-CoA thioesterase FadM